MVFMVAAPGRIVLPGVYYGQFLLLCYTFCMQSCNEKALYSLMEKQASLVLYPVIYGMHKGYKHLTKDVDPKDMELYNELIKRHKDRLGVKSITLDTSSDWKDNAWYNPGDHTIGVSKELLGHPGVLAHELGHAEDFGDPEKKKDFIDKVIRSTKMGGTVFSKLLQTAGLSATTILALKTGNPYITGAAALATAATQIPTIRNELAASKRGKRILEEAGVDPDEAFKKAYTGVPTYLFPTLATAVPVLGAYIANKHFGFEGF